MPEDRPELDPEVMAAVRETQRAHEMRKHKALAGALIAEHLQKTIGARLRGDTDGRRADTQSRIFWGVLWVLLVVLVVVALSAILFVTG